MSGNDRRAPREATSPAAPRRRSTDRVDVNAVLGGGGEMGALARQLDWSRTPVGPVESWPQSLRTAVSILLESKFAMMIAWGPELTQFYNDPFRPILGATKHPALGKSSRDTFPEAWHIVGPLFDQVLRGEAVGFEDMLVPLDRYGFLEECFFAYSYSPIRDESGGVGGLLVTVTETTGRVLAERRLGTLRELASRAGQARDESDAWMKSLEALAGNPADVPFALLYALDRDGNRARLVEPSSTAVATTVELDAQADEPWPLARAASSGEPVLVTDVRAKLGDRAGAVWPEPVHTAMVLRVSRPGSPRAYGFLVAGTSPRLAVDAKYRDFLMLVADQIATWVANARAHEDERRRAEALAEIDRAKTSFFSNMSHEFRTPLTLILGPTEDLLEGEHGELSPEQRTQVELLHRNARRLQKLVGSLLDFSRVEARRMEASYEPVDLSALTRDLASAFRSAMERAGLTLSVDCPTLDEPVFVDRDMWEKIVLNLVSNALKFTFEGGITVGLRSDGDRVVLSVSDTGVGIAPEHVPHVFERFYRVESVRGRTHEGSGIGLALVEQLAKLHGGSASVESRLGAGTTFRVAIPKGSAHLPRERVGDVRSDASTAVAVSSAVDEAIRWLPPEGADGADADGAPGNAQEAGLGTAARVLVVDDNRDMREYVARILSSRFVVEAVETGTEALAIARERPPDLVLADVMMPGLDGFELLQQIRADERTRRTPVILLSARAGDEARVEGLRAGAEDYLTKPFSARELLARVQTHVELAALREELRSQHEHLHSLFMQAPVAISVVRGPDHVYELANSRYREMVGGRELMGKGVREAFPELPADAPILRILDEVYSAGRPYTAEEYRVPLDRDGDGVPEDVFFHFTCHPLRDAKGTVYGIMTVAIDETAKIVARRKLQLSEQRFRALVDASAQIVWSAEPSGSVVEDSPSWRSFTGQTYEEWRGFGWLDALAPDDRERFSALWRDAYRTGARSRRSTAFDTSRANGAGPAFAPCLSWTRTARCVNGSA